MKVKCFLKRTYKRTSFEVLVQILKFSKYFKTSLALRCQWAKTYYPSDNLPVWRYNKTLPSVTFHHMPLQRVACQHLFFGTAWGNFYRNVSLKNVALGKLTSLVEAAIHVELSCQVSIRLNKRSAFGASSFSLY